MRKLSWQYHSLSIAREAIRPVLWPMLALWVLSVVAILSYAFIPAVANALKDIADIQNGGGPVAAFLNRFFFSGVFPGFFALAFPRLRPAVLPFVTIAASGVWSGLWGVALDAFFRIQGEWFGEGTTVGVILVKTALDQFVWNVIFVTPLTAIFYYWLGCGFSWRLLLREWPREWLRIVILPNLIMNWCVWIPCVAIMYMFPVDLQLLVSGFACAFWSLVCLKVGSTSAHASAAVRKV